MSFKKPALLLSSSNTVSNVLTNCVAPQPPPQCRRTRPRSAQAVCRRRDTERARAYSTKAEHNPSDAEPHRLPWPDLGDPPRAPTPYEVFSQQKGSAYSKRRFYELVKLYHPDRHKHKDNSGLSEMHSHTVLLERYRLVIAANAVLSVPEKKQAYDRYGAGWNYNTVADLWPSEWDKQKYSTKHRWRQDGSTAYRWPTDQDPMFNATWEDWERWYRQQYEYHYGGRSSSSSSTNWNPGMFFTSRARRRPLYASNHAFISTVFILAALGGVGQATRAEENHRSRTERTNLISEQTGKDLMQARQDARDRRDSGETKEKRIKRFLSEHESYEEGEFDGRAAREDDDSLCASRVVTDRDQPKFWQRPPDPSSGQSSDKPR